MFQGHQSGIATFPQSQNSIEMSWYGPRNVWWSREIHVFVSFSPFLLSSFLMPTISVVTTVLSIQSLIDIEGCDRR